MHFCYKHVSKNWGALCCTIVNKLLIPMQVPLLPATKNYHHYSNCVIIPWRFTKFGSVPQEKTAETTAKSTNLSSMSRSLSRTYIYRASRPPNIMVSLERTTQVEAPAAMNEYIYLHHKSHSNPRISSSSFADTDELWSRPMMMMIRQTGRSYRARTQEES